MRLLRAPVLWLGLTIFLLLALAFYLLSSCRPEPLSMFLEVTSATYRNDIKPMFFVISAVVMIFTSDTPANHASKRISLGKRPIANLTGNGSPSLDVFQMLFSISPARRLAEIAMVISSLPRAPVFGLVMSLLVCLPFVTAAIACLSFAAFVASVILATTFLALTAQTARLAPVAVKLLNSLRLLAFRAGLILRGFHGQSPILIVDRGGQPLTDRLDYTRFSRVMHAGSYV